MHDDTASRFTLSASRHSNYECELSLNSSCERLRSYCQTCTRFVVVKRHRAVTRVACRLQSAPNGCGSTPHPASLASCGAIATPQVAGVARAAAMHIASATCAALRGELSERNARRSTRNRNRAAARSTRMHVQSHLVRLRNFGTCHVQRTIGVGCVMLSAAGSQCICCNRQMGLWLRWMQHAVCNRWWMSLVTRGRTGRMARKKNGGRSNRCDHRDRPSRAVYLVARRAYLLRIDICGLSLPSLPGCTVKKYSGFHHAPAAHQVQPSHTSLFFSM